MRKSLIFLTCLLLIPSIALCFNEKICAELHKTAADINATLPRMISKEIQLIKVVAKGCYEIEYKMKSKIYFVEDLSIVTIMKQLKLQTQRNLCSKPYSLKMLRKGISFTYTYYDKKNKYIGNFSITPTDCGY